MPLRLKPPSPQTSTQRERGKELPPPSQAGREQRRQDEGGLHFAWPNPLERAP